MSNIIQSTGLTYRLEAIKNNFEELKRLFPKLYLAAEQLNDLFDQMFTQQLVPRNDQLWEQEVIEMLFGSWSSWSYAFIMTAAGLGEHGMTALRRAIEFACYISKIKDSNERASLWVDKRGDEEKGKKFSSQCSIPRAYFSNKYIHLKPLLVWHDHTSEFGAHGNFASLVTKWRDKEPNSIVMSIQDDPSGVPVSTGVCVQIGSLVLDSVLIDLKSLMKDKVDFEKRVKIFKEMLKQAKFETAEYEFKGNIPLGFLKSINENDETGLEEEFENLKKKYAHSSLA